MYDFIDYIVNPDGPCEWQLVFIRSVGTYTAGMNHAEFSGVYESSHKVTSGHVYWGYIYLVAPDGSDSMISNPSPARVYYWPQDFWGRNYIEEE